eukprot:SAG22_NODE_297_length_12786_cov_3.360290_1_plen_99_part_00
MIDLNLSYSSVLGIGAVPVPVPYRYRTRRGRTDWSQQRLPELAACAARSGPDATALDCAHSVGEQDVSVRFGVQLDRRGLNFQAFWVALKDWKVVKKV